MQQAMVRRILWPERLVLVAAARTVEKSHHVDKDVKQDNKAQFSQAEQVSGVHMHGSKRGATSAHTGR